MGLLGADRSDGADSVLVSAAEDVIFLLFMAFCNSEKIEKDGRSSRAN